KTPDVLAIVKKYFDAIPRQPDPPAFDPTEPEQKAERRASVDDVLARVPRVSIAYKTVAGNTTDFYALQVLANALGGGGSSRLNQKLARDKELVTNANSSAQEARGVGGFYINATPRRGIKTEDVEAAVYEEIA